MVVAFSSAQLWFGDRSATTAPEPGLGVAVAILAAAIRRFCVSVTDTIFVRGCRG